MSVYFRTGENTAIGVPWWVYVCLVLPLQLLWWFGKALVLVFVLMGVAVFAVGRAGWALCQRSRQH